jgi:hypothetical protein
MLDAGQLISVSCLASCWLSSVQHLHSAMVPYIYICCHCALQIAGRCCFSILLSRYCVFHFLLFYCSYFTMSDSTAKKIARKVTTLTTIFDNASISDVILEQVIDKVSHEVSSVGRKTLMAFG